MLKEERFSLPLVIGAAIECLPDDGRMRQVNVAWSVHAQVGAWSYVATGLSFVDVRHGPYVLLSFTRRGTESMVTIRAQDGIVHESLVVNNAAGPTDLGNAITWT